MRRLLAGSPIVASHRDGDPRVQDAYSLRCAPQVIGAARDTLAHAAAVAEAELALGDRQPDGPSGRPGRVVRELPRRAGGLACDFLAIAFAEVGAIAERRTDRLLDAARSQGLPPFLADGPGRRTPG